MKATTSEAARAVLLRLAPELFERVDRHVERMRRAAPGVTLTRQDALRSLLLGALDRVESQDKGGAGPPA